VGESRCTIKIVNKVTSGQAIVSGESSKAVVNFCAVYKERDINATLMRDGKSGGQVLCL